MQHRPHVCVDDMTATLFVNVLRQWKISLVDQWMSCLWFSTGLLNEVLHSSLKWTIELSLLRDRTLHFMLKKSLQTSNFDTYGQNFFALFTFRVFWISLPNWNPIILVDTFSIAWNHYKLTLLNKRGIWSYLSPSLATLGLTELIFSSIETLIQLEI